MKIKEKGALTLKQWMALEGVTCQQLANKVGCSHTTIMNIARGDIADNVKCIREIEKLTKESVLLKNIVEESERKKQRKEQKNENQQ